MRMGENLSGCRICQVVGCQVVSLDENMFRRRGWKMDGDVG